MEWTKEKPTREGWYWVNFHGLFEIVKIAKGWESLYVESPSRGTVLLDVTPNSIEWNGPISPPIEQKDK